MEKRTPRAGTTPPPRETESQPAWTPERHSGEGSASALETLHRLEGGRDSSRLRDARDERNAEWDAPPPEDAA